MSKLHMTTEETSEPQSPSKPAQDDRRFAEKQQAVFEQESPALAKQPEPGNANTPQKDRPSTGSTSRTGRPDHLPT
jgi:hypothetical protein